MWLVGITLLLFVLIAPWWAVSAVIRLRREHRAMRERLDALERRVAAGAQVAPGQARETLLEPPAEPAVPAPSPPPLPAPGPAPPGSAMPPPQPAPATPAKMSAPSPEPARATFDSSRAEELIGSVWLQNVGAVLLLLGVFFLVLWGYTNGRIGPGVLVASGVALGAAVMWRGDRIARRIAPFGHALIGIGLGIAYLSLYLGHFTLHVLPPVLAFALLALLSIVAVAIGMRYRVQTIAVLGVVGAFLPQLVAVWIPLRGFSMSAPELLAYMAIVDGLVFVLAARAGWGALALAALTLSTVTWIADTGSRPWGWGIQAGLVALFTGLGLSPLSRLVRRSDSIPNVDLAVVAVAPLCLVACSWPILAGDARTPVAIMLLLLGAVHLVAAIWVDSRRERQELWRPLTGAAVVFVTVALERLLGPVHTPMAWCIEGTVLLWIGLRPRGGWLRVCAAGVTAPGVVWMVARMFMAGEWSNADLPLLNPAAIRDLVCLASVLVAAVLLARARGQLTPEEHVLPELWGGAGNLLLAFWLGREAHHVALAFYGDGGRWARGTDPIAPRQVRVQHLTLALVGAAWLGQGSALIGIGVRARRAFYRVCGYLLTIMAAFTIFFGMISADAWTNDQMPALYPVSLVRLAGIALLFTFAARVARHRESFGANERNVPELWTLLGSLLLMMWTNAESRHVAQSLDGVPGRWGSRPILDPSVMPRVRMLSSVLTSAGWLVQAIVVLAAGWIRRSAFLRWMGLGLFGVTVLKFVLADLQTVDVFWRFLTALVVGAALLGVSYAYQRRSRALRKAA